MPKVVKYTSKLRRYNYTHDQLNTFRYHFLRIVLREWGGAKFKFAPGRQLPLLRHWKQGAVLSPILFTDYIDKLLTRLRESGVGCHIDGVFAGAFGYANDIVLLAPSLDALRHMIGNCEDSAQEFHILFKVLEKCTKNLIGHSRLAFNNHESNIDC